MSPEDVTILLRDVEAGRSGAFDDLIERVHPVLERIARARLREMPAGETLNTVGLVNEAYLRMVKYQDVKWQGRAHFFGAAAQTMRRVIINHARRNAAQKRSGEHVTLTRVGIPADSVSAQQLLDIDEALEQLERERPRWVVAVGLVGILVPLSVIKWFVAGALFLFGCCKLLRNRHPRYGGMRVGPKQLTIWSFLMACAHGAGLMVIPLLLGQGALNNQLQSDELPAAETAVAHESSFNVHAHNRERVSYPSTDSRVGPSEMRQGGHGRHAALTGAIPGGPSGAALVVLFHTVGYLLMTGLAAVVVYERIGLRMLARAWFNIDMVWAASLILTAVLTLVV